MARAIVEAGVGRLAPHVPVRNNRDRVSLAMVFAHEHGAGLEAYSAVRTRLVAPCEAVQRLCAIGIKATEGRLLDVPDASGARSAPCFGVAGFLGLWRRAALVDPDGRKPAFGDAQRECSFLIVTAPDRQRAAGGDFFDQSFGQEFADYLVGGAALQVGRKFNGTVLALRGRGQEHKLGIGESHRDLRSVGDGISRRHHRSPARARKPAGQIPGASMALYEPQQ
jgi:hypothetical protein